MTTEQTIRKFLDLSSKEQIKFIGGLRQKDVSQDLIDIFTEIHALTRPEMVQAMFDEVYESLKGNN